MTSLDQPRLSGLGQNPAAPLDVLVRLAAHEAGRHGLLLRPGQLPDEVVEAILIHGSSNDAMLPRRNISPAMRRRIAEHPDPTIRDAYPDFIRDIVQRRAMALDVPSLEEAYGQAREVLAHAPDPKLRAALVAAWHDRPIEAQEAFLSDPDPLVRAAATRHERPGVPAQWVDRCLADPATRANVACYVPLTPQWFTRLLDSDDEDILHAVASNPHLNADMVSRMLDIDVHSVRAALAVSRHVGADTRDRLYAELEAAHAAGSTSAYPALYWSFREPSWLRDAPLDERLTYLDCPHAVFRQVLASCPDLPADAWARLDNDPNIRVRHSAANRPGTPPDVLERLVHDGGEMSHIRPWLVEHPNFPIHRLRALVEHPDPHVRWSALHDPQLPVTDLHRLATDPATFLRAGAARHTNITGALLDQLLADPEPSVVDAAASNPTLPRARMNRILAEAEAMSTVDICRPG